MEKQLYQLLNEREYSLIREHVLFQEMLSKPFFTLSVADLMSLAHNSNLWPNLYTTSEVLELLMERYVA